MNSWGKKFLVGATFFAVFAGTSVSAALNIVSVSYTADLPEAVTVDDIAIYAQFNWDTNTVLSGTFTLSDEAAVSSVGGLFEYNPTVFTGGTFTIGEQAFEFGGADGVYILDTNNESVFDLDLSALNPLSGSALAITSGNINLAGDAGALTDVTIAGLIEGINYLRLSPNVFSAELSWNGAVSSLNFEHIFLQASEVSEVPEPATFAMFLGLVAVSLVASVRKPFLSAETGRS
ncbi:hypothetical protein ACWPKO_10270 [Coraliomargarita sp. W4R53]